MIRLRSSFLLLAGLAVLGPIGSVRANTVHAWYAPFSVTVDSASTSFNSGVSFNGARTDLLGPFGGQGSADNSTNYAGGFVRATFQADAGYVFTGLGLSFGPWSFSNAPFFGGHVLYTNWQVSGGTYVGNTNPVEEGATSDSWSGSGSAGTASRVDFRWWSGGGGEFLAIMGSAGPDPIFLNQVTSFTLLVNTDLWLYNTSSFGVSYLSAHATTALAPAPVPEGALHPALVGALLLGTVAFGRRRSAQRTS